MKDIDRHALWRQMGACTAGSLSGAPGLATRFDPGSWSVTCHANTWTANWMAVFAPAADTAQTVSAYLDHAVASGRNTSFIVAEDMREQVLPLLDGLPMRLDGNPPLMWRDARPLEPNPRPFDGEVRQIDSGEDIRPALDLIARSFEIDPEESGNATAGMLSEPAMRMFTAESDALDSVLLTWTDASVTYIYILATGPDRQRRGAGRAAMTFAMSQAITEGAGLFYLMASSAGQPLYRALDFETYGLPEFWEVHPEDHD